MLNKTQRQKKEYNYQLLLLERYENRFIRM